MVLTFQIATEKQNEKKFFLNKPKVKKKKQKNFKFVDKFFKLFKSKQAVI